ncbi:MAG TPA: hypothetical protein VF469_03260 [Kofleriaceae bacterium]
MPTAPGQPERMAILCGVALVAVNALFYFLSDSYVDSHHQIVGGASVPSFSPDQVTHIRVVFGAITAVVAAVGFVAGLAPREVGHVLPAVLGLCNLAGGIAALFSSQPGVLGVTLVVSGVLMPTLAHFSYRHHTRAAWAFLGSMCGVFALIGLFGAPKLRGILDVSLWTTMIFPGLYVVAAVTLFALRDDYEARAPARA